VPSGARSFTSAPASTSRSASPRSPDSTSSGSDAAAMPAASSEQAATAAAARSRERTARTSDLRELAGAVADRLPRNAGTLEQRQDQIRVRRVLLVREVLAALDAAVAVAEHDGRQRIGVVQVRVGHVAAVEQYRMVE